jgi:quercetin dioxygenase-like cupin family protein
MSKIQMSKRVLIGAALVAVISAALVWATPGSLLWSTTPVVKSITDARIKIQTHPLALSDILVLRVDGPVGGFSGWHSHPGPGLGAVKAGVVAVYDGDDPTCTPTYVAAGGAFFEEPGHVHMVRNEGSVATEFYVTFVLPAGVPPRTDESNPGNCPF